jgi:hypothetical protein
MFKHWMSLGPLFSLILLTLALWLGVATWAHAQHIEHSDTVVLLNAVVGLEAGPAIPVEFYNTVALNVDISAGTATFRFEGSTDGALFGSSGIACVLSSALDRTTGNQNMTASGLYQCQVAGYQAVRARTTVCTGCTVTVKAVATTAKFHY